MAEISEKSFEDAVEAALLAGGPEPHVPPQDLSDYRRLYAFLSQIISFRDQGLLESDDKFLRHLTDVVCQGLGNVAATCLDPVIRTVDGKAVCLVSCRRSALPVYLRWKGTEKSPEGDFYVRTGPGSRTLEGDEIAAYPAAHFGRPGLPPTP